MIYWWISIEWMNCRKHCCECVVRCWLLCGSVYLQVTSHLISSCCKTTHPQISATFSTLPTSYVSSDHAHRNIYHVFRFSVSRKAAGCKCDFTVISRNRASGTESSDFWLCNSTRKRKEKKENEKRTFEQKLTSLGYLRTVVTALIVLLIFWLEINFFFSLSLQYKG